MDSCEFLTEDIMGAKNFNFASKFFHNFFGAYNSAFLDEKEENF